MVFQRQAEPAELAEHRGTLRAYRFHAGTGIHVQVVDVADAAVGPAARAVDQP